jgi:hypothetical protein
VEPAVRSGIFAGNGEIEYRTWNILAKNYWDWHLAHGVIVRLGLREEKGIAFVLRTFAMTTRRISKRSKSRGILSDLDLIAKLYPDWSGTTVT